MVLAFFFPILLVLSHLTIFALTSSILNFHLVGQYLEFYVPALDSRGIG